MIPFVSVLKITMKQLIWSDQFKLDMKSFDRCLENSFIQDFQSKFLFFFFLLFLLYKMQTVLK